MGGRGSASIQTENRQSTKERAESLLKTMREAGMNPTKSVEETMQILERQDKQNKIYDRQYQEQVKQLNKERAERAAEREKFLSQNNGVYKKITDATKLATAGNYKEAQKAIDEAKKLNDNIPAKDRMWNTNTTPKKLDLSKLK